MEKIIDIPRSEIAYRRFMDFRKNEPRKKLFSDQKKFLKQTPLLEEIFQYNETLFILIDISRCKILYCGGNMESIFGYSSSELKKYNLQLFFRALVPSQMSSPINMVKWTEKIYDSFPEKIKKIPLKFSCCGLQLVHKNGQKLSMLVQYHSISEDENGHFLAGIVMMEDVSHLLKSDFYWARYSCGKTGECMGLYHSQKETFQFQDIVTEREKEILHFISKGFSSKSIAAHLYITQNTVEKHRKNMIARTGARDTTALVHICKRVGVL